MLRQFRILVPLSIIACCIGLYPAAAIAETPCSTTKSNQYNTVSCEVTSAGTPSTGTTASPDAPAAPTGCYRWDGTEVPCQSGGKWWYARYEKYCVPSAGPKGYDPWADDHQDSRTTGGSYLDCGGVPRDPLRVYYWDENPTVQASADAEAVVKTAVATLGLHLPTVGVGAYVYPGYEQWGLSWWVGAPMWLWVDATDDRQWGTHTISATEGGTGVTATVTSTMIRFDPGDGSPPVICRIPGTPRAWNPTDLMRNHSPSKCEYTYMETNTLGDINSRFTVSATVTWTVAWTSTDGRAGSFTTDVASDSNPSIHIGEIRTVLVPPS